MLFNSFEFLFVFLPVVLAGFYGLGRTVSLSAALAFLFASSLVFYGYWNPAYLVLIVGSILANYGFRILIDRFAIGSSTRGFVTAAAVSANLGVLGYFKYSGWLLGMIAPEFTSEFGLDQVELPLAISFFTFQQIAYVVDAHRGQEEAASPLRYALFVVFFPQLIAGPIVHHKEMMPQFASEAVLRPTARRFAIGLSIFAIGLFKKVVVADRVALWASPVFDLAAMGGSLSTLEAWIGAFAYTMQLYFDFSAYSDMAIGIGWLFGIRLPLNFYSPYRSRSIIDFWHRWHMTLSRFLREYLYFSLGGNRKGVVRRYMNLLATMVLGGIWHGAGWTFLVWGMLHGGLLALNHMWRDFGPDAAGLRQNRVWQLLSWVGCFLFVVVGWVFFRAANLDAALVVLGAMFGGAAAGPQDASLAFATGENLFWLCAMIAGTVWLPNVFEIFEDETIVIGAAPSGAESDPRVRFAWRPNLRWALLLGLMAAVALLHLSRVSEFLYFQF